MQATNRLTDLDQELVNISPDDEERILSIIGSRDKIIHLQQQQIERLEADLKRLKAEKDLLQIRLAARGESVEDDRDSVTGVKAYHEQSPRPPGHRPPLSQGGSSLEASPRANQKLSPGGPAPRVQRQRSLKNNNEDAIKRSRPPQSSYQLSQDLHDKQVEMLERKYGGSIRSRRAARTIQRAFRQYCMNKNFQKLRHSYGERRLSKRLSELGRSNTVWTDCLSGDFTDSNGNAYPHSKDDDFSRDIRKMVADFESARSPERQSHSSMNFDPSASVDHLRTSSLPLQRDSRKRLERSHQVESLDQTSGYGKDSFQAKLSRNAFSSPGFHLETANYGRNRYAKGGNNSNSSSGSNISGGASYAAGDGNLGPSFPDVNAGGGDFVRASALETSAADPHSVNFETLLESKETDILTDSFHSEGSSQDVGQPVLLLGRPSSTSSNLSVSSSPANNNNINNANLSLDSSRLSCSPGTVDSFRPMSNDPSEYIPGGSIGYGPDGGGSGHVQVKIDVASPDEENPSYPVKEQVQPQMKYYMSNAQIKYRGSNKQKTSTPTPSSPNVAVVPPTRSTDTSPIWKRKGDAPTSTLTPGKSPANGGMVTLGQKGEPKRMSNISETSEPDSVEWINNSSSQSSENVSTENISMSSEASLSYQRKLRMRMTSDGSAVPRLNDKQRKRLYRIGLNLFNKKPEKGLEFLLDNCFLEGSPRSVARFLISGKGLSKQMIGEFLGNLQNPFNQETLQYFCEEIDLSGHQVDVALRKFQCHFRMPGEAQKIERLMEAFADRYCMCNPDQVKNFKNPDTIFLLAFAIIMLNTDQHNPSVKAERKMKLEDFIRNMRGIDDGEDIDRDLLAGIYDRVKAQEFKAGVDQATQVLKVEQTIIGKKPVLALPHRRLVCYCRLYEVHNPNKKEKIGLHQREVFLFNDLLLVTKIFSKKKTMNTYSFRRSLSLCGMQVYLFETSRYHFGIQLTNNIDGKPLITFNALKDQDRQKFVDDLKESILETNGMEQLRIEEEMARHRTTHNTIDKHYTCDDSRVLAYDLAKASENPQNRLSAPECNLKKISLSNSLTDLSTDSIMKRGSSGASLDSGVVSGSVGSSSSDTHPPGSTFTPSPTTPLPPHKAGGGSQGKRQPPPRTPIVLRPGLPDGTQV